MYKCVIIGCGKIAGGYDTPESSLIRTHAKAYSENPLCKLEGVCDVSIDVANEFSRKWKVPVVSSDFLEVLSIVKPDILSICSHSNSHKEIFEQAIKFGVKKIWLEKPAALSQSDLFEMKKLAKLSGVDVWVNYFRRYDLGFQRVKKEISTLGPIQSVSAYYSKGLRHNGSHLIDLLNWFFGEIIKVIPIRAIEDKSFPMLDAILVTDKVNIYLKSLNYNFFEIFELDIIGTKGRIKIIDGGQKILFYSLVQDKYYQGYQNLEIVDIHDSTYDSNMQYGLEMILNGKEMPSLRNDIYINKVIDLCQDSLKNKVIF